MTSEELYSFWEKHGCLRKVDYNFPLKDLPESDSHVMYPDGIVKEIYNGPMMIDPGIRDLIFDLNRNHHWTSAACQGRTSIAQFDLDRFDERKHDPRAYIGFDRIPSKIKDRLLELGLYVYGDDDDCVAIKERVTYTPNGDNAYGGKLLLETPTEEEKELVIKSNRTFQDRIRKAFDL